MSEPEEYSNEEEYFSDWFSDNKEKLKETFVEQDNAFHKWIDENKLEELKEDYFNDDGVNDKFMEFARSELKWDM